MRILITGGAGFIGSNLARHALERGHQVRIIDDLSTGFRENIDGLETDFREGSILDAGVLASATEGADAVIHLAAVGSVPRSVKDPFTTHEVNARGTLNVIMAARDAGVEHISVASSSSVYGMNPAMPKHEREWVRAMSPYAVSKLATEQYALAAQQSYSMSTIAFRFFNVYGPNQRPGHAYAAVIPVFLDAMAHGKPLPVNGDGEQSRDFTFVDTVCSVLLDSAVRRISHPEPVNLAFGTRTSLNQLIERIKRLNRSEVEVEYGPPRVGDVRHSQADSVVLQTIFPDLKPFSLDEGLRQTFKWLSEE